MGRAREGSRFVSEQFAFEQVGGHRGAVHFEESAVGARRKFMDQPRQHFLAGTAFTEQEDRDVDVGDERGLGADLLHRRAGSDEEHVVAKFLDIAGVGLTLGRADALPNDRVEFGFLERLGQIIDRAEAHRLHDFARVIHAGEHDNFQSRLELAQLVRESVARRCRA